MILYIHKYVDKTSLTIFFDFCQQISHNFKNQSRVHKLKFSIAKLYLLLVFFQNSNTEYNYFNVISILTKTFLIIAKSNLTYPFYQLSTHNWNMVKIYTKVFYHYYYICRCPSIRNR